MEKLYLVNIHQNNKQQDSKQTEVEMGALLVNFFNMPKVDLKEEYILVNSWPYHSIELISHSTLGNKFDILSPSPSPAYSL